MESTLDFDHCLRAIESRDPRFDGTFVICVTSTGIYCRPSCPAVTPKREHMRFLRTAAAAQQAGFRACKRCRPDAAPGSPEWDLRADLVGRAMRLIADGEVERTGVQGLARRLGYSERQLHRLLVAELGAGPLALARARRAQTARLLLETTSVPISELALAAGFGSIRQFNATIREVYALTPTELRRRAARGRTRAVATPERSLLRLRLAYRPPLDFEALLRFLGERAVPGVEEVVDGAYRRVLALPHGLGIVTLAAAATHVDCELRLEDLRDLTAAVQRCRRLLDLDADPLAIADALGRDRLLAPLVRAQPGLRVPGHVDPHELAVRAVLGQQVSVAAARTLAGRLAAEHGLPLAASDGSLTHAFPSAAALAEVDPETARDAPLACACTGRPGRRAGAGRRPARPRRRPRRGRRGAAGPAGHRSLDRELRAPARPRRSRRLPGLGPRRPPRPRALRPARRPALRRGARRALAALALVRAHALLELPEHGCSASACHHAPASSAPRRAGARPMTAADGSSPAASGAEALHEPTPGGVAAPAGRLAWDDVPSPIGDLLLVGDGNALVGLYLIPDRSPAPAIRAAGQRDPEALRPAAEQLEAYFAGELTAFDLPLAPAGTAFQRAVWDALLEIPYGETVSYGEIARQIGDPSAVRAVGAANGRNPISIVIPCHRVIGANGTLTGYGGGLERKRALLALEASQLTL